MKKSLLLHLGFWSMFLFLLVGMAFMGMETDSTQHDFLYYFDLLIGFIFVPALCAFYAFYHWVYPKYKQQAKRGVAVLSGVPYAVGASAAGLFFLLFLSTVNNSIYEKCIQEGMVFTFIISLGMGFVGLVMRRFISKNFSYN